VIEPGDLGLKWDDVDFHVRFIEIRRARYMGAIQTPKSGKGRQVDMAEPLAEILLGHRKALEAETLKRGRPLAEWAFPSPEGKGPDGDNVRKLFRSVLTSAKVRKFRFHDLRHSYESWLIGNGESLAYVRDQLGHSSIQVTVDVYGHLIPGANRQAADRVAGKVLSGRGVNDGSPPGRNANSMRT
jgi:integrase